MIKLENIYKSLNNTDDELLKMVNDKLLKTDDPLLCKLLENGWNPVIIWENQIDGCSLEYLTDVYMRENTLNGSGDGEKNTLRF